MRLPYDKGIQFDGDKADKEFIDFDKVINHQAEVLSNMQNAFDRKSAALHEEIDFLKSIIQRIPHIEIE